MRYVGPHIMNNKPIIVKAWALEFNLGKEMVQTIQIQVKLPNLSLNCWGMQSLRQIESGLGIPIYIDKFTTQVGCISYARLLVVLKCGGLHHTMRDYVPQSQTQEIKQ